jgi:thymidylate kinase
MFVVEGAVGTGKTKLVEALEPRLEQENIHVVVLGRPAFSRAILQSGLATADKVDLAPERCL